MGLVELDQLPALQTYFVGYRGLHEELTSIQMFLRGDMAQEN